MALPLYLAKQTTATTGTGTVTLNALTDTSLRSFQAAAGGSAIVVRYEIRFATGFEIGIGTYDGGSPGTLTRTTVIASSNAGSLVNLAAGTKDVFLVPDFDRPIVSISGTTTLTLADIGNLVAFTGSSSATLNLPAVASVPPGAGYSVKNNGTAGACLTIDPSGAETIDGVTTLAIAPGESAEIYRVGSAWVTTGLSAGFVTIQRQVTSGSVATMSWLLPAGFEAFRINFRGLSAAGNPDLLLRLSTNAGVSYLSGASDYGWGGLFLDGTPAPAGGGANATNAIRMHSAIGSTAGEIGIFGARDATALTAAIALTGPDRTAVSFQSQTFGGRAVAAADHNAVQLLNAGGANFTAGAVLTLMGLR